MMTPTEGPEAAKAAGLRYTTDEIPGIRRVKRGKHFAFVGPDGKAITDKDEVARIKALAIPPAYTDVWICPLRNGHLQATGRDARGRKQYRYHARWRAVRDETKFERMLDFARALPAIRKAVARDLALRGMPREKVLATVVSLLEQTAIRVGNEEYARANESYGLTTLQEDHVDVAGSTVRFHFRGKSGKVHDVEVRDRRIAKIVRDAQDLPGQHLFEYLDDDGTVKPVHSGDVNDYIREISGGDFTAKDFRTWEGTMTCALELAAVEAEQKGELKHALTAAITRVAEKLGNTPAVCKKSYIHPGIIETFLREGALELIVRDAKSTDPHALDKHERAVIALIERIVADEAKPLGDLLAKSVRAASATRRASRQGTTRTSPRAPRARAR